MLTRPALANKGRNSSVLACTYSVYDSRGSEIVHECSQYWSASAKCHKKLQHCSERRRTTTTTTSKKKQQHKQNQNKYKSGAGFSLTTPLPLSNKWKNATKHARNSNDNSEQQQQQQLSNGHWTGCGPCRIRCHKLLYRCKSQSKSRHITNICFATTALFPGQQQQQYIAWCCCSLETSARQPKNSWSSGWSHGVTHSDYQRWQQRDFPHARQRRRQLQQQATQ